MNRLIVVTAVVAVVSVSMRAEGQLFAPWSVVRRYHGVSHGQRGMTPQEARARAFAEVLRARSQAAKNYSQAMLNYQQARQRYIENQQKWAELYRERQRMLESRRAREQRQREIEREHERRARQRYLQRQRDREPPRLSASELDRATGQIEWPEPLLDDQYAPEREKIQEWLSLRATTGDRAELGEKIAQAARDMQEKLKRHIREMPAYRYIEVHKFLEKLAYEGMANPIRGEMP